MEEEDSSISEIVKGGMETPTESKEPEFVATKEDNNKIIEEENLKNEVEINEIEKSKNISEG